MTSASKIISLESFSKWQIALLASLPATVAIGLGLGFKHSWFSTNIRTTKQNGHLFSKEKAAAESDYSGNHEQLTSKCAYLKKVGDDCFQVGEYEKALQLYTEAIGCVAEQDIEQRVVLFQSRAAAHERLNNMEKVIEDCTAVLILKQNSVEIILRRAKAAEAINHLDLVVEDMAAICILEHFDNSDNVTKMNRMVECTASRDVEEFLKIAPPKLPSHSFIKTYVSTYHYWSVAEKVDVNDTVVVKLLQELVEVEKALLSRQNITERCNRLIQKCEEAELEEIKTKALLWRITFNILSNRNKEALIDLKRIICDETIDSGVRINAIIRRAWLHENLNDIKKRDEDFLNAVAIDEENPFIYYHWGRMQLASDNVSESVINLRKATSLDQDCVMFAAYHCFAEYKLATLDKNGNNIFRFINEFKNLMIKFPQNIECLILYAQVLSERQEFYEADELLDKAIKFEPHNPTLWVHKALLMSKWKSDAETAKSYLYKALDLDRNCEFAYEILATLEKQSKQFDKALTLFTEAIKRFTSRKNLFKLFRERNALIGLGKAECRVGSALKCNLDF